MKTEKEVISTVNHLLEICNERIQGYKKAAEKVKDPMLNKVFYRYISQTEGFASELAKHSNEKNPSNISTRPIGDAWRLWMDMKAAITNGGTEAMLGACETGENAAIRNYEKAMEEDLPLGVKNIVIKQLAEIKLALNEIKRLKSELKK
jgi:uncharacterized protein (TIGR02284 family)